MKNLLTVIGLALFLVFVVASYYHTWNQPYNFKIILLIPWWAWLSWAIAMLCLYFGMNRRKP